MKPKMKQKAPFYRNYLLTIRAERGRTNLAEVTYRFSLKDPQTGQHHACANLTTLVTALLDEIIKGEAARLRGGEESKVKEF